MHLYDQIWKYIVRTGLWCEFYWTLLCVWCKLFDLWPKWLFNMHKPSWPDLCWTKPVTPYYFYDHDNLLRVWWKLFDLRAKWLFNMHKRLSCYLCWTKPVRPYYFYDQVNLFLSKTVISL